MNHAIEIKLNKYISNNKMYQTYIMGINIFNDEMKFTRYISYFDNFSYNKYNKTNNEFSFYCRDGDICIKLNDLSGEVIFEYEDYTSEPNIMDIIKFKLSKYESFKKELFANFNMYFDLEV
jgi:hypothetical protein